MRVWMHKETAQLGVAIDDWWDRWMWTSGDGYNSANPADFIDLGEL